MEKNIIFAALNVKRNSNVTAINLQDNLQEIAFIDQLSQQSFQIFCENLFDLCRTFAWGLKMSQELFMEQQFFSCVYK